MNKKLIRTFITVIVIILVIALIMKIPFVGQAVADAFGKPLEVVNSFVDMVVTVAVGLLLIFLSPFLFTAGAVLVGAAVVLVGLVFVGVGIFSFRGNKTKPQIED